MKVSALIVVLHVVTIVVAVPVDIGRRPVDQIISDAVKNCTGNCKIGVHGRYMISNPEGPKQIVEYKGKWQIVGTKEAAARDTPRDLAQSSVGNVIQNEKGGAEFPEHGGPGPSVYGTYYVNLPGGQRQIVEYMANQREVTNTTQSAARDAAWNASRNAAKVAARNTSRDAAQASAKDAVQNGKQDTELNAVQRIARDTARDADGDAK